MDKKAKRRQRIHARISLWRDDIARRVRHHGLRIDPSVDLANDDPSANPKRRWQGLGLYGMAFMDAQDDLIEGLEDRIEELSKAPNPSEEDVNKGKANNPEQTVSDGNGGDVVVPGPGGKAEKKLDGWEYRPNGKYDPATEDIEYRQGQTYVRAKQPGSADSGRRKSVRSDRPTAKQKTPDRQPAALAKPESSSSGARAAAVAGAVAMASTGVALADAADEKPAVTTDMANWHNVIGSTNLEQNRIVLTDDRIQTLPQPVPHLHLDMQQCEVDHGLVLDAWRQDGGVWIHDLPSTMTMDQCEYDGWNACEISLRGISSLHHQPQNPVFMDDTMLLYCEHRGDLTQDRWTTNAAANRVILSHKPSGQVTIGMGGAGWQPWHKDEDFIKPIIQQFATTNMDQKGILDKWYSLKGLDMPCILSNLRARHFASHRDGAALGAGSHKYRGFEYRNCVIDKAHGHGIELSGDSKIYNLTLNEIGGNAIHGYGGSIEATDVTTNRACQTVPNAGYGAAAWKNYPQLPITKLHIKGFSDTDTKANSLWNDFLTIADIRVEDVDSVNAWRDGVHQELSNGGVFRNIYLHNSNTMEHQAGNGFSGAAFRVFNSPGCDIDNVTITDANCGGLLFYSWAMKGHPIGYRSESGKVAFHDQPDKVALCYSEKVNNVHMHCKREHLEMQGIPTGFSGYLDDAKEEGTINDQYGNPQSVQVHQKLTLPDGRPWTGPSCSPKWTNSSWTGPKDAAPSTPFALRDHGASAAEFTAATGCEVIYG